MKRLMIGGLSVLTLFATAPAVSASFYLEENGVITAQARQSTSVRAVITSDETLYLDEDQTHDLDLRISNSTTVNGVSLPAGSIVRGRFEPYDGGLRYVADSVRVGDRTLRLRANSEVIDARKDPRETSLGSIATDSAIGAAAGAALGEIFGSIDLLEVLGGAAAGAVIGNVTAPTVVVLKPDTPITLYVQ